MKIAYLANSTIPSQSANSIHVMKMCQAFTKNGHEVKLFVPQHSDNISVEDMFEFYGIVARFEIVYVRYEDIKGRAFWLGMAMANRVEQYNPDFVLGRILTGCFFAARKGYTVFFEAHQPIEGSGKIYHWLFKYALSKNNFKKVIVITKALKKYLLGSYKIEESTIIVASDAADNLNEEKIPKIDLGKKSSFKVGYVGHMYPGKGMEIISELVKLCPAYEFHLIGGKGEDLDYWQGQLQHLNNVFFYGFIPHSETASYMISADVLIAPYLKTVESTGSGNSNIAKWTSPLKLFEYMAAQKPIISSNLPVLQEVLEHNVNALLCAPDDINEWEKSLKEMESNPKLRERLAESAYQKFINNYTWSSRAQTILNNL